MVFDANMSRSVGKALALLDRNVTLAPVSKQQGVKGEPDVDVALRAKRQRRCIFTNNFDMVVAAVSVDAPIIWFFDRKQNSPTKFDTAWLWFRKWDYWERTLSPPDAYCLRVSMDRTTLITKEAALAQASRLDIRAKRRASTTARRPPGTNQLSFDG